MRDDERTTQKLADTADATPEQEDDITIAPDQDVAEAASEADSPEQFDEDDDAYIAPADPEYDLDVGDVEGEAEMREMIAYIARVLVEDTEAVQVDSQWDDGRLSIKLRVADDDKGKVIGKRGRVVHAMQSLVRVAATKSNMRASVDVE